jgi:alpha-1,2-glucosyltransferase
LLYINIPNLILLYLFNHFITSPYMDEYFHFNQFLAYHKNQFSHWDPKITTPPGLYIIQRIFAIVLPADLSTMRMLNSLFFSNIFVVYVLKIYDFLEPCPGNLSRSLNLALTPTIYFFNFLDYTDSASVSVIAAMFYYNLTKSEWRLGFVSLISVFIRQNNVIWILYLIIYRVLSDNKKQILAPKSLPAHLLTIVKIFLGNKMQILKQSKFQIMAIAVFGGYVYYFNDGRLVFGDHEHHKMVFHPNQLLYLSLFCIANFPITLGEYISSIGNFFQRIYISRHALAAYLFLLSLSIILVDQFTLIHPFIRDDNRHYTFYIYRYLLKPTIPKFALCLGYAFSFHFIFKQVVNS